jgi:hypothetical protein
MKNSNFYGQIIGLFLFMLGVLALLGLWIGYAMVINFQRVLNWFIDGILGSW